VPSLLTAVPVLVSEIVAAVEVITLLVVVEVLSDPQPLKENMATVANTHKNTTETFCLIQLII
jgi:hypothetical protein